MPLTTADGKPLRHIISTTQFSEQALLEQLFHLADTMEERDRNNALLPTLQGKILACLFYEPSTRTRFSFEAAMQKLGGGIITAEDAADHSSAVKGETLEDTIKIVSGYADGIVLRHYEEGSALRASAVSPIPIVSAGDGAGEHPTQALLDVYTIIKELKRTDAFTIALVGDLRYGRTIHSLFPLFALFERITIRLVSPAQLRLPEQYKTYLKEHRMNFEETDTLDGVLPNTDILYVTRIQRERFSSPMDYEAVKGSYVIKSETLHGLRKDAIIMHPLPRVNEIAKEVDNDVRAAYFRQAKNGLYIRMALLDALLT